MTATTHAPDHLGIRSRRDRLYWGAEPIGRVARIRTTGATGKPCWRWRVACSVFAFGMDAKLHVPTRLYRPGPDEFLPGLHTTRNDAVASLLTWLHARRAPVLGYGPHPEVAAK